MAHAGGFSDGRASKEAELGMAGDKFLAAGSPRVECQVVDAGVKELFPPYILQHVGAA